MLSYSYSISKMHFTGYKLEIKRNEIIVYLLHKKAILKIIFIIKDTENHTKQIYVLIIVRLTSFITTTRFHRICQPPQKFQKFLCQPPSSPQK